MVSTLPLTSLLLIIRLLSSASIHNLQFLTKAASKMPLLPFSANYINGRAKSIAVINAFWHGVIVKLVFNHVSQLHANILQNVVNSVYLLLYLQNRLHRLCFKILHHLQPFICSALKATPACLCLADSITFSKFEIRPSNSIAELLGEIPQKLHAS